MSEFNDKCPTREELQEYACGVADSRIEEHLRNCATCRAALEKEETITRLLDEYMTPPAELNENILQACKDAQQEDEFLFTTGPELRRRRSAFRTWRPYLAAAALLVVGVIIGVVISSVHDIDAVSSMALTDSVQATDRAVATISAPAVATQSVSAMKAMARSMVEDVVSGPVNVADASEGFSLRDSLAFSNNKTASQDVTTVSMMNAVPRGRRKMKVSAVDEEVTHVWLTDALPSESEMQALLDNNGKICTTSAVDEDGVMTISLVATDQTVQKIADRLYATANWRLLSPESPQPGQAERTHFDGHPVKYNIKVVPR